MEPHISPAAADVPAILTKAQMAKYLQVSLITIDRYVRKGYLRKGLRLGGPVRGQVRWLREDLFEALGVPVSEPSQWKGSQGHN